MSLPHEQPDATDISTAKRPAAQSRSSKDKQHPQGQQQPSSTRAPSRPSDTSSSAPTTQSKKTAQKETNHNTMPSVAPPPTAPGPSNAQDYKKINRRSSKPIIDWFQRKLGGSVRARRASESAARARNSNSTGATSVVRDKKRPPLPEGFKELTRVKSTPSRGRRSADREVRRSVQEDRLSTAPAPISLNDDDFSASDGGHEAIHDGAASTYRSSFARDSMWSPNSHLEADEDASLRPLPPSAPPSPSPSRSSASYLSDPKTFRSMAASTKPTTLLSIDLAPNGMAHIAQAPPTPISQRVPAHMRSSSGAAAASAGPASITFSALASSPDESSRPPSEHNISTPSPSSAIHGAAGVYSTHYPQHTSHHPRNNPRPSSPPNDDASLFTLASSAFGIPGARTAMLNGGADSMSVSHQSHFAGSRLGEDRSLHFPLDNDGDRDTDAGHLVDGELDLDGVGEKEVDASVRALRPRSSRRGSWESEASGWSARVGAASVGAHSSLMGLRPGTPSALRDRSLWTGASVRTGTWISDQIDPGDMVRGPQVKEEGNGPESDETTSNSDAKSEATHEGEPSPISSTGEGPVKEQSAEVSTQSTADAPASSSASTKQAKADATPKHIDIPTSPGYEHSIASTNGAQDVWHSAPTTPMF